MKRDKDRTNKRRKCGWIREERKEKGKEKEEQTREREKNRIERERNKKMDIFPAFRRSNLDGSRVKVDPHIKGYAWVLKSWSFVKLHEVRNFSTLIIYNIKVI